MTDRWWAAHPDVRKVIDAADELLLTACARDLGFGESVEVPRYETRERPVERASEALDHMHARLAIAAQDWPDGITPSDACVARVVDPNGHKRTAVVVVLRRGRVSRAIVVYTEAP